MAEKDKIEAHNTPSNDSPDIESTDFAAENSDCTPDDSIGGAGGSASLAL